MLPFLQEGALDSRMNTKTILLIPAIAIALRTNAAVFNPANGHYYDAIAGARTWSQAKLDAEALGGYLATLTSPAENAFVAGTLPSAVSLGFWLGGFQQPGAGPEPADGWEWVSGEAFVF